MYALAHQRDPVQSRTRPRGGPAGERQATADAGAWLEPRVDVAIELPCSVAPDLFFAERPEEIRQARALCQRCPALGPCLAGALQRAEPWGVWGGELILCGSIIPGKRARGRPRSARIRSGLPEAAPAQP